MKFVSLLLPVLILFGCSSKRNVNYEEIASYQDHTVPVLQMEASDTTKVLIVVPHADDETIAGGLISTFQQKGATIHLLMLCKHDEIRTQELNCSAEKLGITSVETGGFVNNTWEDIMKNEITFWYDFKDSIKQTIYRKVRSFNPNVLITYDTEIGGYGHPEHLISAQLTEDIFNEYSNDSTFQPKFLYQITLTDQLEDFLVAKSPGYALQRELTGSNGLPIPDIAIDIREQWPQKNAAAQCHQSQMNILSRFFIAYDETDKEQHLNAFPKEYYRLLRR